MVIWVLDVDVAERASKGVHSVALSDVGELGFKHGTQRHGVVHGTVPAGRQIQEGNSVGDSILTVLDVLVLPRPPDAVELSVVDF